MPSHRPYADRLLTYAERCARGELTPRQQQLLDALAKAGDDGLARRELAALLGLAVNTVDAHLRPMQWAGLICNSWSRDEHCGHTSRWFIGQPKAARKPIHGNGRKMARKPARDRKPSAPAEPDPILTVRQSRVECGQWTADVPPRPMSIFEVPKNG